jgi:hypothetical protein
MARVGVSAVRLIDSDGDAIDDGSGKLNVNATLVAGASIDIGDVEILGHGTFNTYPQFAVGTDLVQLSSSDGISTIQITVKEMIIQADADNSSFVMVGDANIAANDTDGIRINAGDTLILPLMNTTTVYFRSGTADQKVNVALLF